MQIHYAGKVTRDDFLNCLALHNPQLKRQRWLFGIIIAFLIICIVYLQIKSPAELAGILPSFFPGGLIALIVMTFPWWTPYVQLMSLDQKGNIYHNNVYGMIDDSEISINGAEIKADFQWSGFVSYKTAKDMLLLYRGKNNFSIFTRSMFSNQSEWDNFVALTKDKIALNTKRA